MDEEEIHRLAERAFEAYQEGNHLLGLALTDQLVEAQPENPVFRCWRVHALLAQGKTDDALAEADLAVQYGPAVFETHLAMACAAAETGDGQRTRESLRKAVEVSDGDPRLWGEYAMYVAHEGASSSAEAVALEAIEAHPELPEAWVALGVAQARRGRPAEAESSLRRALELDPNSGRAQGAMALLLSGTGRRREAQALGRLMQDNPEALAYRDAWRRQQRLRDAARKLEETRFHLLRRRVAIRRRGRIWAWLLSAASVGTIILGVIKDSQPILLVGTILVVWAGYGFFRYGWRH